MKKTKSGGSGASSAAAAPSAGRAEPKQQKPQPKSVPIPQKSDEGSIEQQPHERLYGQSQQFGDSQGYDMSVDSNQLEKYDYFEEVKK